MAKIYVTPEELAHMQDIYSIITRLTEDNNGVPALISSSRANQYRWNINTLRKMIKAGALDYCKLTDIYNLSPTNPKPPTVYFTTSAIEALTV